MTRMHLSFLFVLLLVIGCTDVAGLLPLTAAPATGDFVPCAGYGTPPPGSEGRPGPWANRLMVAYSDDGLTLRLRSGQAWTRANRIVTDQADVPDAIVDDDGVLRVYYVTWCPGEVHNQIVAALSADAGQAWSFRHVTINGMSPGQPDAVDPDIVRTDDGRWRLYFTSAPATPGATPRTYSAISDDGFTFDLEQGYRLYVEGKAVLDPSVILVGDTWHLFAGGGVSTPGYNWHATSTDGLNFTQQDDFWADGMVMANGLQVDGGYRFYGFRPSTTQPTNQLTNQPPIQPTTIYSIFTADGVTWTMDPGARLSPDPSATLEALGVKDPAVARLPDGRYVMVYVTTIPEYLESPTPTPTPTSTPSTSTLPLTWQLEPGLRVSGKAYDDGVSHNPLAPDVIQLDDGRYRMFYSVTGQGIGSAISSNGLDWTVEPGLRLQSQRVEGQLHFDVGHPTVVHLADGRWRMYFQSSTGLHTPLRVASAVSSDGFNFTLEEGIRIDIGPGSEYSFAGHGRVWRAADGSFWMLFSANTHDDTGPSDIALTTSSDGLTWTTVEPHLFVDGHDPTLLVNADGSVTALWMYLDQTFYTSHSTDGLNWSTPVEVLFYDENGQQLIQSPDNNIGDVALLRLDDGSLRLFTNWRGGIRSLMPTQSPISNLQYPYLLSFHGCDPTATDCRDPRNHQVYLAQSDDGADWSLVPGWEPYQGSVPDVIRRGDTLYVYTPGRVRRYRLNTDTWQDPVPVMLTDPEATGGFVDPTLFVDDQGQLVLFYLLGIIGQNPAGCGPKETTCVKHFHSAVEVGGSDGTEFVAEPGDRVQVTISPSNPSIAADPDIFYDGGRYVLYISRGSNVQVYTSPTLHGSYTLSDALPNGYLVHGGGVPSGYFDPTTARYWTYVHTGEGIIRRAVHASLDLPLNENDFNTVLTGSSIGLGTSYRVESPGFAVNTAGTTDGPPPTATPTPTPTTVPAFQCVRDANGNGQGDVTDIEATAAEPGCLVYLPQVVRNWRQPWPLDTPTPTPTPTTPTPTVEQLPINLVYVNHVEVESVLDYLPPLVDGTTYATTSEEYTDTSGKLEWEMAQAEAVGARISFHMSGAYAERAVDVGAEAVWAGHLADGHTVGVHFHSFLHGSQPFQWTYSPSPDRAQIAQAWQDNHDLVSDLVGSENLWVGESHYACPSCWQDLGYQLRTTEQMAQLPAGQHIVWLVERDRSGVITYPHFPQIGQAAWHGPAQNRNYFDLRVPQLKKEFLMLYLEWLERERLGLEPQVWAWGWLNHGGRNTDLYAEEIQEILTWLSDNFAGRTSPRGNVIAEFVNDHQLSERYEAYEQAGGQPLPSPTDNVNDQFPYMAYALQDAGVTADLSAELGLPGIRLFELERNPAENPPPGALPKVYLLFRETDGSDVVDISGTLAPRGVDAANLTLVNVVDGSTSPADGSDLLLEATPLVLEAMATPPASDLNFVPDPGFRVEDASNPAPSVDPETGTVYLFYEDHSTEPGRRMVATSSDGLSFSAGRPPTEADNPHHPFHVRLPDGTWRRYLFDQSAGEFRSQSSTDGIHYTPDPGARYVLQPGDNGTAGIHDEYVDPAGGVVLLYIGDMGGVNNVRRAYSPPGDNGWTFTFEDGNVLGDADAGGGPNSYVDQKSILLPDGRRRLFTMKQGTLYSFISSDGKNYTLEPGVRLSPADFTGFQVRSLHDPVVVLLPDGRYRMYVAAAMDDGSGDIRWAIVSATSGSAPIPDVRARPLR